MLFYQFIPQIHAPRLAPQGIQYVRAVAYCTLYLTLEISEFYLTVPPILCFRLTWTQDSSLLRYLGTISDSTKPISSSRQTFIAPSRRLGTCRLSCRLLS